MGEPIGYAEPAYLVLRTDGRARAAPRTSRRPLAAILDEFRTRVAPHQLNAYHPRSLSYFTPPPLLAVGRRRAPRPGRPSRASTSGTPARSATFVEEEVIRWLCDLVGYGAGSFGLLTSGGVMANFLGDGARPRRPPAGLRGSRGPPRGRRRSRVSGSIPPIRPTSRSAGRSTSSASRLTPWSSCRPTTASGCAPSRPPTAIRRDRAAGLTPMAISAVAGSTNTGSVDRHRRARRRWREREGLWFHVDAAYGAAARLSPRDAGRVPGLERADSVTVDPHKWFFQAYDIGGLVVRDGALLERDVRRAPARVLPRRREPGTTKAADAGRRPRRRPRRSPDQLNFWQLGFEGTRRWRALKLWM